MLTPIRSLRPWGTQIPLLKAESHCLLAPSSLGLFSALVSLLSRPACAVSHEAAPTAQGHEATGAGLPRSQADSPLSAQSSAGPAITSQAATGLQRSVREMRHRTTQPCPGNSKASRVCREPWVTMRPPQLPTPPPGSTEPHAGSCGVGSPPDSHTSWGLRHIPLGRQLLGNNHCYPCGCCGPTPQNRCRTLGQWQQWTNLLGLKRESRVSHRVGGSRCL